MSELTLDRSFEGSNVESSEAQDLDVLVLETSLDPGEPWQLWATCVTSGRLNAWTPEHLGWSAEEGVGPEFVLARDDRVESVAMPYYLMSNGAYFEGGIERHEHGEGITQFTLTPTCAEALEVGREVTLYYPVELLSAADAQRECDAIVSLAPTEPQ